MPKTAIAQWSSVPGDNKDIGGINIDEGCPPGGINNAIRELMAQIKLGFATQAQMESASASLFTSPAVQQHHPSAAKAWARVTETAGDYLLTGAYNIASVVDNGTGNVTVNFETDFSSAAYACFVTTDSSGTTASATSPTVGSVVVRIFNSVPTAVDDGFYIVAFGDQ